MSLERTDLKYNSDFREKQMKVLQETIRNMQTQLLQTKMREQKDAKTIEQLEKRLTEAGVKQLLLKTKIRETNEKLRDRETCASVYSESSEVQDLDEDTNKKQENSQIIDIDVDKSDDEVKIIDDTNEIEKHRQKAKEKTTTINNNSKDKANERDEKALTVETSIVGDNTKEPINKNKESKEEVKC